MHVDVFPVSPYCTNQPSQELHCNSTPVTVCLQLLSVYDPLLSLPLPFLSPLPRYPFPPFFSLLSLLFPSIIKLQRAVGEQLTKTNLVHAFASLLKDPEAEVRAASSNRLRGRKHV